MTDRLICQRFGQKIQNRKYIFGLIYIEMGFNKVLDGIFFPAEIGSKKPDRDFNKFIFREFAKKNIFKEQIFYIDDTVSHIESAEQYGIDSYLCSDFKKFNGFIYPLIKTDFY